MRVEPKAPITHLQLPTAIEQMILLLNNFSSFCGVLLRSLGVFFRKMSGKIRMPMHSSN